MTVSLRFGAQDVRILQRNAVYDGHFKVCQLTLEHRCFDGSWSDPLTRELFERGDAVGVLPYNPINDSLVLIEQFRPGAVRGDSSPWMLELIAGVVEEGESDESVVHRESMEEAGCELSDLMSIAGYFPSAGACSEHVRLYCGRVQSAQIGSILGLQSEGEDILVHEVARTDAMKLLFDNQIPNGHTLVALQWLALHIDAVREHWS
ncbi:MAG: NUDIX domain-containing protein [Halioglobus sp.]